MTDEKLSTGAMGLRGPLRRLHRAGWVLFVAWAGLLVVWAIVQPDPYVRGWRLVLELMFLGRAVSIADGISSEFSAVYLLIQNGLEDIVLLLIVYPWVVHAYEQELRSNFIGKRIDRIRKMAERNKRFVEPFGVLGLWIFVFFPFWSTGALVGGVVGYLLGMRTWVVFTTVALGHVLSCVVLIWAFDVASELMAEFDQGLIKFLPWMVLLLLFGGTAAYRSVAMWRTKRRRRRAEG